MTRPRLRSVRFAAVDPTLEARGDGGFILRSAASLGKIESSVGRWLDRWASVRPEAIFLTEPGGRTRRRLSYGVARTRVRSLAAGLLARGLGPERPLVILSGNGIDHALLSLAAQYVGVPVVPVSASWTLLSDDAARVGSVLEQTRPGLVYADDPDRYATGLSRASPGTAFATRAARTCRNVAAPSRARPPCGRCVRPGFRVRIRGGGYLAGNRIWSKVWDRWLGDHER